MPRSTARAFVVAIAAAWRRRRAGMAVAFLTVATATVLAIWLAPRTYRFQAKMLCQYVQPGGSPADPEGLANFIRTQREIILSDAVIVPAVMRVRDVHSRIAQGHEQAQPGPMPDEVRRFIADYPEVVARYRRNLRVEYPPGRCGATSTFNIIVDSTEQRPGLLPQKESLVAARYRGERFLRALLDSYQARRAELQARHTQPLQEKLASAVREASDRYDQAVAAVDELLTQARRRELARLTARSPAVLATTSTAPVSLAPASPPGDDACADMERLVWITQCQRLVKEIDYAREAYDEAADKAASARKQIRAASVSVILMDGPSAVDPPRPIRPQWRTAIGWGLLSALGAAIFYLAMAEALAWIRGGQWT